MTGLRDYVLSDAITERLAPVHELAREVVAAAIALVVCVTDGSDGERDMRDERRGWRLADEALPDPGR